MENRRLHKDVVTQHYDDLKERVNSPNEHIYVVGSIGVKEMEHGCVISCVKKELHPYHIRMRNKLYVEPFDYGGLSVQTQIERLTINVFDSVEFDLLIRSNVMDKSCNVNIKRAVNITKTSNVYNITDYKGQEYTVNKSDFKFFDGSILDVVMELINEN